MSEDTGADGDEGHDHEHDHVDEHDHDHESTHDFGHAPGEERVTSPMQDYTITQVGFGAAILGIGVVLTFGLGFLL